MKCLLLLLFSFITICAVAQQEIKLQDIRNHIGDSIKLKSQVYNGKYLETSARTPTFLAVGAQYPHAPLRLVIWGDVRKLFRNAPETYYVGKDVWITGVPQLNKNKPEVVIYNPNQIIEVPPAN